MTLERQYYINHLMKPRQVSDKLENLKSQLENLIQTGTADDILEFFCKTVTELEERNEILLQFLLDLKKQKYGRKSETLSEAQLQLFENLVTGIHHPDKIERIKKEAVASRGRKKLPEELPREIIEIKVEEPQRICPDCGTEKALIGYETSEVLEYVPAHFKVLQYQREKRVCKQCESHLVVANVPNKLIEKGLPGPGLIGEILISKYNDHLPLYRLQERFERIGVSVARSSMSQWIAYVTEEYLSVIALRMKESVLKATLLQTDDTPMKVLDKSHPKHIKNGYYWVYIGDGRSVVIDYTTNKSRAGPESFLAQRQHGYLQSDGYTGYKHLLCDHGGRFTGIGCWMHARRYFYKAWDNQDTRAASVIEWIQQMYRIEEEARSMSDSERYRYRQEKSKPLLDQISTWMNENRDRIRPQSLMGKAIGYTTNHWDSLIRYVEDGAIPIDNGAVERAIRPIAIGRKNYLFSGSDDGAQNSAVIYSILCACDLAGVNQWRYLQDILHKMINGWKYNRIDELLPYNWTDHTQTSSNNE